MKRFFSVLLCATLAGLFYVYAEVEAVRIGYTIRKQEEKKTLLLDRARALKYNIARLKAPDTLEKKLVARRIELQSPKSWQTLVLSNGSRPAKAVLASSAAAPFFSKFFVGTARAEAKENR